MAEASEGAATSTEPTSVMQVKAANETKSVDNTHIVAEHYNKLKDGGLQERTKSRIFYMRNFNNWLKSMVISDVLTRVRKEQGSSKSINVLDLCCGKGGDLLKWKKGRIDKIICADIAATSVEQCEGRYKEMVDRGHRERYPQEQFAAEFIAADCTKVRLKSRYKEPNTTFDIVSCQFSFHYCFESYKQADMMLRNACECLSQGGYFIGTTVNALELVRRLRASDDMSFGNDVYKVTFKVDSKEDLPLFGAEYDFQLEGVVNCPEFLMYFQVVEKMAEKYGMKLIFKKPFAEFFKEQITQNEGRALIGRMQALEPYPADQDVDLMGMEEDSYAAAKRLAAELTTRQESEQDQDGGHRRKPLKVGTLSLAEWEATSVYMVFAFQKVSDKCPDYVDEAAEVTTGDSSTADLTTEDVVTDGLQIPAAAAAHVTTSDVTTDQAAPADVTADESAPADVITDEAAPADVTSEPAVLDLSTRGEKRPVESEEPESSSSPSKRQKVT